MISPRERYYSDGQFENETASSHIHLEGTIIDTEESDDETSIGFWTPWTSPPRSVIYHADSRISFYSYEIENLGNLKTKERTNYLVMIPFTLERAENGRRYLDLTFEIEFDDKTHLVRDLAPKETETVEFEKRYWITPRLSFSDVVVELGGTEVGFTIEKLVPRITPFYRGEPRAKWLHENENGLEYGCKYACLLLSVPEGTETIHGRIEHSATVSRRFWEGDDEVEKAIPTRGGGQFIWELPEEDEPPIFKPMVIQPLSVSER